MSEVVTVGGLFKRYGKHAPWAVEDVSFSVGEGEIVGLLGHNGAGKSTTLRCLEGMIPFDKGSVSICGRDIVREPVKAKANMGFVTDDHAVFVKMTGVQYLDFMADIYKVPVDVRAARMKELEEVFALGDSVQNLIASYSHGMRQKICMMGSLIHRPKLWVLDEPMTGGQGLYGAIRKRGQRHLVLVPRARHRRKTLRPRRADTQGQTSVLAQRARDRRKKSRFRFRGVFPEP